MFLGAFQGSRAKKTHDKFYIESVEEKKLKIYKIIRFVFQDNVIVPSGVLSNANKDQGLISQSNIM